MTMRLLTALLAIAFMSTATVEPAFARGGGGGGGGGGGNGGGGGGHGGGGGGWGGGGGGHGNSGHGGTGGGSRPGWGGWRGPDMSNPQDRDLLDRARHDCNGPQYPSGATMQINWAGNTYNCFEPGSERR